MDQNLNTNTQPEETKIHDKFTFKHTPILVVIFVLILGMVIYFFTTDNNIDNTVDVVNNDELTTEDTLLVVKDDFYAYGNKVLFLAKNPKIEYEGPGNKETVYIINNDIEEIIPEIWGTSDFGITKFYKTSQPQIALLRSGSDDYYYINLNTKSVVEVKRTHKLLPRGDSFEIVDVNKINSELSLSISDCKTSGGEFLNEDEVFEKYDWYKIWSKSIQEPKITATLEHVVLNKEKQNIDFGSKKLACSISSIDGSFIYNPVPKIEILGFNDDLSKLFFSVAGNEYITTPGKPIETKTKWTYELSVDLNDLVVREESFSGNSI